MLAGLSGRGSPLTLAAGRNGQSGLLWREESFYTATGPQRTRTNNSGTQADAENHLGWNCLASSDAPGRPAGWWEPGREMDLDLGAVLSQKAWRGPQKALLTGPPP